MQVRTVGGRRYTDPDVLSLIGSSQGLDPFTIITERAAELLERFNQFPGGFDTHLARMCALASLAGYDVQAMDMTRSLRESRDAVFVPTAAKGRKGLILYNPNKPPSRIVHSIAHEICHSFFPNSRFGAQFRSIQKMGAGPAPEIELLCDYGAAELTMPRSDFLRALADCGDDLGATDRLRQRFGTSFEATVYRIATVSPRPKAAGLFVHRSPKRVASATQGELFGQASPRPAAERYRRQSFHHSSSYPGSLILPWNKSLPEDSVVYSASKSAGIVAASEQLGIKKGVTGAFRIEAIVAPYQPASASAQWPNALVMLTVAA